LASSPFPPHETLNRHRGPQSTARTIDKLHSENHKQAQLAPPLNATPDLLLKPTQRSVQSAFPQPSLETMDLCIPSLTTIA
jgi:hypothetical protein